MQGMPSAHRRLATSFGAGLAVAAVAGWFVAWEVTMLAAWTAAASTFLAMAWRAVWGADSARTRAIAQGQDETRLSADLIILAASVISLVGVGFILLKAEREQGLAQASMTTLGLVSIVLAWSAVHTVYALRYADLYYVHDGGIEFHEGEPPDYRDFAYFAFTIGMTYQVSDTELQTKLVRRMVLRHALLSYVFGTAIIAVAINAVAGLAR
jgi:uncharacterized membrane protein